MFLAVRKGKRDRMTFEYGGKCIIGWEDKLYGITGVADGIGIRCVG